MPRFCLTLCAGLLWAGAAMAQHGAPDPLPLDGVNALIVTAHPDDEAMFAGSVYRMAVELGAAVDLALVTDGAGGYRFSVLAERLYGRKLTDPEVARQYLPAIRKQELMAGGRILGLRKYYFLDQPDTGFTQDPDSILGQVWDGAFVLERLTDVLREGDYDYVLTHLPRAMTHGHHKSATVLALRASKHLEAGERPVVLGSWISNHDDAEPISFAGLEGYPVTRVRSDTARYRFDRMTGFGEGGRLNYQIVANWLIAEHKSQGTMQLLVNLGEIENFWVFESNPEDAEARTAALFDALAGRAESDAASSPEE